MNSRTKKRVTVYAVAVLGCLMGGIDIASAQAVQGVAQADSASSDKLDEIVVTAQLRSENIQNVPIAVTVITSNQIQDLGIVTTQDVQLLTPNLTFTGGYNYAQAYIRGIGTTQSDPGLEPAVATYVDGAYTPRAFGGIAPLFDMANVEVLKGAQGTLYGRNATGGAILYTTVDPTMGQFSAHTTAEYGDYNHKLGSATVDIPLVGDSLALRVGIQGSDDGAYLHNFGSGYSNWGSSSDLIARAKLKWQPAENFSAVLSIEHQHNREFSDVFANRSGGAGCGACALPGGAATYQPGFYDVGQDASAGPEVIRANMEVLRVNYSTSLFDFTSVSSHRQDDGFGAYNVSGTSVPFEDYPSDAGGTTWGEEFRGISHLGGMFDFMVGGSYNHDRGFMNIAIHGALVLDTPGIHSAQTSVTRSYSGFAEGYLTPVDRLKITVGARYTVTNREWDVANAAITSIFFGTAGLDSFAEHASFHDITPRFVVDYDLSPVHLYASYNRGFKEGGFNMPFFSPEPPVDSEQVDSYEIGTKYVSDDRRLRMNGDIFYYKYSNIQVNSVDTASGADILENAAGGNGRGAEVDASYNVYSWLNVFGNAAYLRAKYTSYANAAVDVVDPLTGVITSGVADLSGATRPDSPTFSGSLGVDVHRPITDDLTGHFNINERYTTRYDFFPGGGGPSDYSSQAGFGLMNISSYVEKTLPSSVIKSYRVGVFVNNATDKRYYILRSASPFIGLLDAVAKPMTFGLRASADF
jgi:iron complex outermembrane recepter protein